MDTPPPHMDYPLPLLQETRTSWAPLPLRFFKNLNPFINKGRY